MFSHLILSQRFVFACLDCLTSSLVPVKPFDDSSSDFRPTMEIEEFCQSCPEAAYPHTSYVNNFYVYPISLNYSNQKVFSKVCCWPMTVQRFRVHDAVFSFYGHIRSQCLFLSQCVANHTAVKRATHAQFPLKYHLRNKSKVTEKAFNIKTCGHFDVT